MQRTDSAARHDMPGDARLLLSRNRTASQGQASPGTILLTMEINELLDDELLARAREWRLRALRGEKDARGMAHELERELRQRTKLQAGSAGTLTQDGAALPTGQATSRPAWRFW